MYKYVVDICHKWTFEWNPQLLIPMEKPMNITKLTASDGFEFESYLVKPASKPRGAIVVLQEIFGVNSHIRSICKRLVENGYEVIAPAIFDRIQPSFESGYTSEEVAQAKSLMQSFKKEFD